MKKQILVIGGGASGMTAAIFAARAGASVTILEHGPRLGKKILSTGNGRCNLTNLHMGAEYFRGGEGGRAAAGFVSQALVRFGGPVTRAFFGGLGLVTKDKNGYVYPRSEQASAVLDLLLTEVRRLGIRVVTDCGPETILARPGTAGFNVKTPDGSFACDRLILAAGSKAAPVTGSDGSGYALAGALGYRIVKPLPALVQLRCREKYYKRLQGIRTDGAVTLKVDGKEAARDAGEIQLTDYGISGIPVFQVSRFAAVALDQGRRVEAVLDLCPEFSFGEVCGMLEERSQRDGLTCGEMLNGWFNKKLIPVLLTQAGIAPEFAARSLKPAQIKSLASWIKGWTTQVLAVNPFANAQVCCGGVDVRQVHPRTMEGRLHRGLYFAGELLDVDGICGGYNLQWAWTSGALAGMNAGGNG